MVLHSVNNPAIPSELSLVFNLIRNSEAREMAQSCLNEIFNYLSLLKKLPKPGPNIKEFIDLYVYRSIAQLQQFEQTTGVSTAIIALGAFYSNESRNAFIRVSQTSYHNVPLT